MAVSGCSFSFMQGESMRKIDTEAYNKRLHTEIMELDKMIKSINPENINKFDARLIETADTYIKLISDATWDDRSNFNGIEMHKVKDLANYLKLKKRKLFLSRDIIALRKEGTKIFRLNHTISCPEGYDGRSSIVVPRVTYESKSQYIYNGKIEDSFSLGHDMKYVVYKQPLKIIIDFEIEVSTDFSDIIYMSFFYLMWK